MKNIPRKLVDNILFSLKHNPVVFVNGPRQAGKSTLVKKLLQDDFPAEYVSFDNITQMSAASESPHSFLSSKKSPLIIDEVQLVPEIFRALKMVVDDIRLEDKESSNGRFLLTGSANIMALPGLSDSLVGRMSVKTLYPFAGFEVMGGSGLFVEKIFDDDFASLKAGKTDKVDINEVIAKATFPEVSGKHYKVRSEWFEDYLTTILQRDVRSLAEIEKISALPALLRIMASRAGGLLNYADMARDAGLNQVTAKNYINVLKALFLFFDVLPWYKNIGKRLVKSPKGYMTDSLLLCHLLGLRLEEILEKKPMLYGHVIENFVATELTKLLAYGDTRAKLHHFRTSDDKEVDFVLEGADGSIIAIEVKSSDMVEGKDFRQIKLLESLSPKDFLRGIVLYRGDDIVPFGENLYAVPLSALWQ